MPQHVLSDVDQLVLSCQEIHSFRHRLSQNLFFFCLLSAISEKFANVCGFVSEPQEKGDFMGQILHFGPHRVLRKVLAKQLRKTPVTLQDDIPFGRIRTDHMAVCDFIPQKGGWQPIEILPYEPFEFWPDSLVFHYGQQIFEGMKAYLDPVATHEKTLLLFRPDLNAKRFHNSAVRLGMEPVPEDLFLQVVQELLHIDGHWALPLPGSIYIRPCLIPLDQGVSYRAGQSYRFFVILSPSVNYYTATEGLTVAIERNDVRAVPGGVGEAKCGGNYAAALPGLNRAKLQGAEQVLWLDGIEHRYIEEVGAMNIMFVENGKILTPALSGSILPGVTRRSVIDLAKSENILVEESKLELDKILDKIKTKQISEVFGCGTAAVIAPISLFLDKNERIEVQNPHSESLTQVIRKKLTDIQFGLNDDPYGWRVAVKTHAP
jgi:branched-chain amino acid aminotransferase